MSKTDTATVEVSHMGQMSTSNVTVVMCDDPVMISRQDLDKLRDAQAYTYIGKDGKSVLARDLEDERDKLREAVVELQRCITDQGFPYDGHMLTICRDILEATK